MSSQGAPLLRAIFSNAIGLPFGNIEIFPSYSTEPSLEHRTLNRLCVTAIWFVICAWITHRVGWWNHMAAPATENETVEAEENEHDEHDGTEMTEEEILFHQRRRQYYEQQRQQEEHDRLEDEAHLARATTWFIYWNDIIVPLFVVVIFFSRLSYAFHSFASAYSIAPTWKNHFVFVFGEWSWWDIGPVVCVLVAWVFLHLGAILNVDGERYFHLWLDELVQELLD
ncbi:hypothetical protein ONS95_011519 [Cadophora gregata]|uniref:uncharacterized protein n=1 Tax=Cadophora gregata TaxID=51156 RepID=UPI0026DC76AC|nr:uncharacterized protein ONS95_011519 [Cadophora gregata]KAK0120109.1 hypothetical protein ONS95_011519 [Cadophora gregata]KAK0121137.1 hypothetical protein ONS96_011318 [Cadophora gregata f. sp. sojae]